VFFPEPIHRVATCPIASPNIKTTTAGRIEIFTGKQWNRPMPIEKGTLPMSLGSLISRLFIAGEMPYKKSP
jgi:hypothetical protein